MKFSTQLQTEERQSANRTPPGKSMMERARTSVGTERPCPVCGGLRGDDAKEVR